MILGSSKGLNLRAASKFSNVHLHCAHVSPKKYYVRMDFFSLSRAHPTSKKMEREDGRGGGGGGREYVKNCIHG